MQKPLTSFGQFKSGSPLSFQLLAYILLCSSVFTLLASGFQIYSDYRQDISLVDERMSVIETSYMSSLSRSLWALDQKLLQVQMEGILSLPDIVHLRLRVYPDSEMLMGEVPREVSTMSRTFRLVHKGDDVFELGELTITASLEEIYNNLRRKLVVILTTQAFKTFFLSLLILWIFQYFVTRHLSTMAGYARNFRLDELDTPLVLPRKVTVRNEHDELAQVTDAFNEMRVRLKEDVERQKKDAAEIRKLSLAIEQSPSSVLICDPHWNIEYANGKFVQLSGHDLKDVIGKHPAHISGDIVSQRENEQLWQNIKLQVQRVGVWQGELHSVRKNGERFWEQVVATPIKDTQGETTHFLILGEDISIRKRYEQQLLRQANYDILTGLPNRMLALDRLKLALAQARRENLMVGIMFLDLDNFKHINDTLGHDAGDGLLIEASRRISSCLRGTSTVARLGGDEFLVVLPGLKEDDSTVQVAERILQTFSPPFSLHGQEVFVSTSIGIAIYPTDAESSSDLLQHADAAMYQAKSKGKSAFARFTPEMKAISHERLQIESRLRRAMELNELELHFQPIVEATGGKLLGAEALLRWNNGAMGTIAPDRFIPLAEETGLITPIGEWVLRSACAAAQRWHALTGRELLVAVNVSPRQFRDGTFVEIVRKALQDFGISGHQLELEITERLLLDNTIETAQILRELDDLDVRLSVDDFGTGYSALGYLKSYPFDTLKIDRSFVRDVMTEQEDAALVKAIINMAHSLGLQVVAEGVEESAQLHFLQHHGCDYAQGYYFTRPLPEAQFLNWIEQHQTRKAHA